MTDGKRPRDLEGPAGETPGPESRPPEKEEGGQVDSKKGRGQVDKKGKVPGKEEGRRPQDAGTYSDAGSRKKARGG